MTAPGAGGRTLRTKLVTSIVVLYVAVTVVTGATTSFVWHTSQLRAVDDQLGSAAQVLRGKDTNGQSPSSAPGAGLAQLTCRLWPDSKILPNKIEGRLETSCYTTAPNGTQTEVSQSEVDRLDVLDWHSTPRTIRVNGQDYRAVAVQHSSTIYVDNVFTPALVTDVRGLPLDAVNSSTTALTKRLMFVALLGLVLVGGASWLIVGRNLAPLRRVAGTAQRVTQQPLATGEVRTAERVAPEDTDPYSEVGQVGLALNGLLEHVDASLSARHRSEMQIRQFVADASHELRTPLASIKGYAELSARETEPIPESITHALGRIESESERMTALVEDMLLLARLDSGRPLAREPVDLTLAVLETVSDARAAGPDHRWALDLPDEPCEVIGDDARLRQILINLLGNARKHTPPGTVITTGVRPVPGGVEISVADTGPGIPPELQPRIFERFARGDSARQRREGSTGLGLSIVQAVVSAHGGRVGLQSEPGRTVFTATLPAPPVETAPPAAP